MRSPFLPLIFGVALASPSMAADAPVAAPSETPAPTAAANPSTPTVLEPDEPRIRFKFLVFDLENTLLDANGAIPRSTIEAMSLYRFCGGRIAAVSSQNRAQALPSLNAISPDMPVMVLDGAMVIAPQTGTEVRSFPFESGTLGSMVNLMRGHSEVEGWVFWYPDEVRTAGKAESVARFLASQGIQATGTCRSARACLHTPSGPPLKVAILPNAFSGTNLLNEIQQSLGQEVNVSFRNGDAPAVLITSGQAQENRIINDLLAERKVMASEMLVFGNAELDPNLLGSFPWSVSVGAPSTVNGVNATFVIGSDDPDAVGDAIRRFVIGATCFEPPLAP